MSHSVHCADPEDWVGSLSSSSDWKKVTSLEDGSDARSTAFREVEQPQTSKSGPCSDSDEFSSVQSNNEVHNCALDEAEAEQDHGVEHHSDDSQEAPLMPPLPSKLLFNLKSTCESRDESSPALLAGGSDTARIALDDVLRSAYQAEHAKTAVSSHGDEELLTVMLKNLPCRCSEEDLLELLAAHGWGDSHNFFHLPMPKRQSKGFRFTGSLGYAFIGFDDPSTTKRFMQEMKGVRFEGRKSMKVLDIVPARLQGLQTNLSALEKKKRETAPCASNCSSSKDILPMQELHVKASQQQHEDATVMPPYSRSWNPIESGFLPLPYMWSDSLQYQQPGRALPACEFDESYMHQAASGPPNANAICYSPSAGFMPSFGVQSFMNHSYWNQDNDSPEEQVASDLETLSLGIESVDDQESQENLALHAVLSDEVADEEEELLTVMMKNIPCRCSQQEVLDLLAAHGWADSYNFFHLPAPPRTCKGGKGCLGYAFIGFPDPTLTRRFMHEMKGVGFSTRKSAKVIEIAPARYQGLHDNFEYFSGKKNQSSRAPIYKNQASTSQVTSWTTSF